MQCRIGKKKTFTKRNLYLELGGGRLDRKREAVSDRGCVCGI